MDKESLREVLGVGHIVALSPHIGVKGIPVGAAERFQGLGCLRRLFLRRRQHHAPMRGGEFRRTGCTGTDTGVLGIRHGCRSHCTASGR